MSQGGKRQIGRAQSGITNESYVTNGHLVIFGICRPVSPLTFLICSLIILCQVIYLFATSISTPSSRTPVSQLWMKTTTRCKPHIVPRPQEINSSTVVLYPAIRSPFFRTSTINGTKTLMHSNNSSLPPCKKATSKSCLSRLSKRTGTQANFGLMLLIDSLRCAQC